MIQVRTTARRRWLLAAGSLLMAGCASIVDKPQRPALFDMGPIAPGPAQAATKPSTPLVIPDIDASGALDSSAILYRLAYADDHQLRAYALSRWSAPPPQLLRQRLRQQLGRDRPVLNVDESAAIARQAGEPLHTLRLELEDFVHVFDSPDRSRGLLRLRATLLSNTASGEVLLGQRSITVDGNAPTADASGGVRALTAAADSAAQDIHLWLRQLTVQR